MVDIDQIRTCNSPICTSVTVSRFVFNYGVDGVVSWSLRNSFLDFYGVFYVFYAFYYNSLDKNFHEILQFKIWMAAIPEKAMQMFQFRPNQYYIK